MCSDYSEQPDPPGSIEFLEMARDVMQAHNLSFPVSMDAAVEVYITLTTVLESYD